MIRKFLSAAAVLFITLNIHSQINDYLGLNPEYSMDEFRKGIRSYQDAQYENAIGSFIRALSYDDANNSARYYLGESYRKAGYEKNALYVWNTLLAMGDGNRYLKNKLSYLYNRRGMLTDILVDTGYVLREDIKGYYEGAKTAMFLNPSQIAVGKDNHYYIASFQTGSVVELDANFKMVRSFIPKNPELKKPFGVAVDSENNILVSDFGSDRILKINRFNLVVKTYGYKGIGEGALLGPKYIAVDKYDNVYVIDSGNKRINKYSKDGNIIFSFALQNGVDAGELSGLFLHDGSIYVCDKKNGFINVYDESGNFIRKFGSDYLIKPYDITMDKLGRFIISCEDKVWAYEPSIELWYTVDALGQRLKRGVSVVTDVEDNIVVSDFNSSRVYVMSLERRRYNSLYVSVERVMSAKFPDVHLFVRIEKDDFTTPAGIDASNIAVFENSKVVSAAGMGFTELKNRSNDIAVIYDNSPSMIKNRDEVKSLIDTWMKNSTDTTRVLLSTFDGGVGYVRNELNSTRLQLLDSIDRIAPSQYNDKGEGVKNALYGILSKFSKKSVVIITDGRESGRDFEKFAGEDLILFAMNNDVKINVVTFGEGEMSDTYRTIARKTGGRYLTVYRSPMLKDLFADINKENGKEFIISYRSPTLSRFGKEAVNVEVEVDYNGMKGLGDSVYYPSAR